MNDDDELLDLVDDKDNVIGTILRKDGIRLDAAGGNYIRFATVLIMNKDNKVWYPVRSLHKTIAPGGYDNSAEGHVETGESYEVCAIRELNEELGITITADQLQPLSYEKFPGLPYFCKYFLLRTDKPVRLSDEHTSGEWLTPQDIRHAIASEKRQAKETVAYGISLIENYLSSNQANKEPR